MFHFALQKGQSTKHTRHRSSSTSTSNSIHPLAKKLFLTKLRKSGVALTATQLIDLAKDRRIPAPTLTEAYRFIREDVPELAGYSGGRTKPKGSQFQTIGVPRSGVFFIDYAQFKPKWSGSNNKCTGFLLAVENLSNRLFALPTRGKNTNEWLTSIAKFLENTRDVNLVYSDRDSVALSERFRRRLEKRYGIRWQFLAKDNKSYLAETYIGYVKRKLGQGLRSLEGGKNSKRWIHLLQAICDTYNHERVAGTNFRRGAINRDNFNTFLGQLFKEQDVTLSRFNSFKAGPFDNERWNKDIFKFAPGDKVLVVKSAIWKKEARGEGVQKDSIFTKRSSEGAFARTPFTIAGRQLRAVKNYKCMVPVYSLKEIGERHLNYYEPQMRRVGEWRQPEKEHKKEQAPPRPSPRRSPRTLR